MKSAPHTETVVLTAPRDFRDAEASALVADATAALAGDPETIEVDLSNTTVMDGSGVGALLELDLRAIKRNPGITLRLRNPISSIRHLLELARLNHLYEITGPGPTAGSTT